MNTKMIKYILAKMVLMEGLLMMLPALVGLVYKESISFIYIFVGLSLCLFGYTWGYSKPKNTRIFAKEGFVIVALSWVILSIFGAMPFYITREIPSYIDAFFETVSGFTTTGSTIINDIEALSRSSMFWRSFSHWIGGMGILVFVVAFLPQSSGNTLHILQAEMPGPIVGKLTSKIKVTARLLYIIYAALTILEMILLFLGGMNFFDCVVNSFSTAGTGGFGIWNNSIAYYDSAYIDSVITIFMALFGINFNLIYFLLIGKFAAALKSEELRWYLGIILGATLLISINVLPLYKSIFQAFRYASFTVVSIITTTGFITADYQQWPLFSKTIIVSLMFIGAMAGSTGGGIKVSRIMMYIKKSLSELKKLVHPHSVSTVKFEGEVVHEKTITQIHTYLVLYAMVFIVSLLLISLQNIDYASAFTAVTTCINNVGPGLNVVGPVENFSSLTNLSKLVLCFDMLAGRLEIFPILLLFSKDLWVD